MGDLLDSVNSLLQNASQQTLQTLPMSVGTTLEQDDVDGIRMVRQNQTKQQTKLARSQKRQHLKHTPPPLRQHSAVSAPLRNSMKDAPYFVPSGHHRRGSSTVSDITGISDMTESICTISDLTASPTGYHCNPLLTDPPSPKKPRRKVSAEPGELLGISELMSPGHDVSPRKPRRRVTADKLPDIGALLFD